LALKNLIFEPSHFVALLGRSSPTFGHLSTNSLPLTNRHVHEKFALQNDFDSGLKLSSYEALDFPSINAGVNIKHTFINSDIYVGAEID
jgi:hypothetical protein